LKFSRRVNGHWSHRPPTGGKTPRSAVESGYPGQVWRWSRGAQIPQNSLEQPLCIRRGIQLYCQLSARSQQDFSMQLVTMGEAAERLGVSVDTVRRRLRRGELKGRHQLTSQGFIWLIEAPEPVGANTGVEPGPGKARLHLGSAPAGSTAVRANATGDAAPAANDLQALRELAEVLRHEIEARDQAAGFQKPPDRAVTRPAATSPVLAHAARAATILGPWRHRVDGRTKYWKIGGRTW
jgi:hypothetical protein